MTRNTVIIRALAAGLILSPLAACDKAQQSNAAASADPAKATDEAKALIGDIVDGYNHKDADKAVATDAPDMVGMFHGLPNTVGPDADMKQTKAQIMDPNVKLAVSNESYDAAASGDLVVYRSTYAFTMTDPKTKQPATEVGNWLAGMKRQPDGKLKVAWSMVSDTPAAAAKK